MPIDARRMIRKMRGGSQAHLMEAFDGFPRRKDRVIDYDDAAHRDA